jgi:hypothetical protein
MTINQITLGPDKQRKIGKKTVGKFETGDQRILEMREQ